MNVQTLVVMVDVKSIIEVFSRWIPTNQPGTFQLVAGALDIEPHSNFLL